MAPSLPHEGRGGRAWGPGLLPPQWWGLSWARLRPWVCGSGRGLGRAFHVQEARGHRRGVGCLWVGRENTGLPPPQSRSTGAPAAGTGAAPWRAAAHRRATKPALGPSLQTWGVRAGDAPAHRAMPAQTTSSAPTSAGGDFYTCFSGCRPPPGVPQASRAASWGHTPSSASGAPGMGDRGPRGPRVPRAAFCVSGLAGESCGTPERRARWAVRAG